MRAIAEGDGRVSRQPRAQYSSRERRVDIVHTTVVFAWHAIDNTHRSPGCGGRGDAAQVLQHAQRVHGVGEPFVESERGGPERCACDHALRRGLKKGAAGGAPTPWRWLVGAARRSAAVAAAVNASAG